MYLTLMGKYGKIIEESISGLPSCRPTTRMYQMPFALTTCNFPGEFSCKSGSCIDIYKRCDNRKDCDDGSDEDDCALLQIPESYDKALPPELGDDVERPNEIFIQVNVIHVDVIDTVSMVVGLTVDLVM